MSIFNVGFSRVNINPVMGTPICGYYKERFAEGILDDLEVNESYLHYNTTERERKCSASTFSVGRPRR